MGTHLQQKRRGGAPGLVSCALVRTWGSGRLAAVGWLGSRSSRRWDGGWAPPNALGRLHARACTWPPWAGAGPRRRLRRSAQRSPAPAPAPRAAAAARSAPGPERLEQPLAEVVLCRGALHGDAELVLPEDLVPAAVAADLRGRRGAGGAAQGLGEAGRAALACSRRLPGSWRLGLEVQPRPGRRPQARWAGHRIRAAIQRRLRAAQ
jgi:hypothetical protein